MNTRYAMSGRAARAAAALLAAAGVVAAGPCVAQADWKPSKTVEFVVGSGAGGGNDRTARLIQKIWSETKWLENVVVSNKPGGGGAKAYTYVSQQAGDGHFLAVTRKAILTNFILGRSPLEHTELTPLAVMANEPNAVTVRTDFHAKNLKDFVETFRTNPQSITTSVGSTRGGPSHMVVVQLAKFAGADLRNIKVVTFNGSAESITGLLGGHIQAFSSSVDAAVEHHRAGKMRILGIASAERSKALPDVPTFREQGYDVVVGNWTAITGPKNLTPAQVSYWENLLERTFKHPLWQGMLNADALEHDFRKAQAAREMFVKDYATERALLTELGMAK